MFIRGNIQEKHKLVAVLLLFPSYFCIVVISYANNGANSCIVVEFFERMKCLYI